MRKIICFDIDNVICKTKKNYYHKSTPIKKNIAIINRLYDEGYFIKLFTARYMGRSNENAAKAKKKAYLITTNQLKLWKIKFHKLIFGKPSFDVYIDDKNIDFKKNWINSIRKKFL